MNTTAASTPEINVGIGFSVSNHVSVGAMQIAPPQTESVSSPWFLACILEFLSVTLAVRCGIDGSMWIQALSYS